MFFWSLLTISLRKWKTDNRAIVGWAAGKRKKAAVRVRRRSTLTGPAVRVHDNGVTGTERPSRRRTDRVFPRGDRRRRPETPRVTRASARGDQRRAGPPVRVFTGAIFFYLSSFYYRLAVAPCGAVLPPSLPLRSSSPSPSPPQVVPEFPNGTDCCKRDAIIVAVESFQMP